MSLSHRPSSPSVTTSHPACSDRAGSKVMLLLERLRRRVRPCTRRHHLQLHRHASLDGRVQPRCISGAGTCVRGTGQHKLPGHQQHSGCAPRCQEQCTKNSRPLTGRTRVAGAIRPPTSQRAMRHRPLPPRPPRHPPRPLRPVGPAHRRQSGGRRSRVRLPQRPGRATACCTAQLPRHTQAQPSVARSGRLLRSVGQRPPP